MNRDKLITLINEIESASGVFVTPATAQQLKKADEAYVKSKNSILDEFDRLTAENESQSKVIIDAGKLVIELNMEKRKLHADWDKLEQLNLSYRLEHDGLKAENAQLRAENEKLTSIIGSDTPIAALTLAETWKAEKAAYVEENAKLREENDRLNYAVNYYYRLLNDNHIIVNSDHTIHGSQMEELARLTELTRRHEPSEIPPMEDPESNYSINVYGITED